MSDFVDDETTRVPSEARGMRLLSVELVVVDGPDRGKRASVRDGVARIGTAEGSDLRLADRTASRVHCELRVKPTTVLVRDAGSTNGTFCEGLKITEAEVPPGATIRVGGSAVRIEVGEEPSFVEVSSRGSFGELVGSSVAMRRVYAILERVAQADTTVLVQGETGTGKDVVARSIHAASKRASAPFVPIDCGAVPESLFESELFGHVRGAFSGAVSERKGVFEEADGGTLFLDEIGELPLGLQAKLLRAIETRTVRRIGANAAKPVDVRIVAATNRTLSRGGRRRVRPRRKRGRSLNVSPMTRSTASVTASRAARRDAIYASSGAFADGTPDARGRRMLLRRCALALALLSACGSDPASTGAASGSAACPPTTKTADLPASGGSSALTEVTAFGENGAGLQMFVHAPAAGHASAVVVAMHGCTETASDYVAAGWNELADRVGAVVVYPQQTTANDATHCFRWWEPAQTSRGAGEVAAIAAMADYAKKTYGAAHVYVTGLSAGAAMTAAMLASYPDVFEAGAIMSGLPYACATTQAAAYSCMNPGKDQTAQVWAALVPAEARAKPPRVAIWHGDADYIVRPANEVQLVRQWAGVNGVSDQPSSTEDVGAAKHALYKDASGAVRVESWLVTGMGHGLALAPSQGCGKAGAYLLDVGLCSTEKAAAFFGLVASAAPGSPDPAGSLPVGGGGAAGGGGCK